MENSKNILIINDMPGYGKVALAAMLPAAFDAAFPAKEKAITESQREFQVMCGLAHEVIPNGFMQ